MTSENLDEPAVRPRISATDSGVYELLVELMNSVGPHTCTSSDAASLCRHAIA